MPEFLSYVLGAFIVLIVVFLLCRELVCWYFKINEILVVLNSIADSLKKRY